MKRDGLTRWLFPIRQKRLVLMYFGELLYLMRNSTNEKKHISLIIIESTKNGLKSRQELKLYTITLAFEGTLPGNYFFLSRFERAGRILITSISQSPS